MANEAQVLFAILAEGKLFKKFDNVMFFNSREDAENYLYEDNCDEVIEFLGTDTSENAPEENFNLDLKVVQVKIQIAEICE